MADDNMYLSSFGGLRLWLSRISTDRGRSIVEHAPSAGDDYTIQDRGQNLIRARASALFEWMDGDDLSPVQRIRALLAMVDDKARMFSHPIEGSYLARVGPFSYDVDASTGAITAELEFVPVADVQAVSPVGGGSIAATGAGAVSMAAEALAFELEDVGITSDVPAQASAAADSWASSDPVNPRDVLAKTGSLTSQLGDQADDLDDDLDMWTAYKATVILSETVRAAAEAATADTAQTFVVRVGTAIALRALLQGVYSAEEADLRYQQAMALNDIVSPAWIEPGTELQLPLPSPAARAG
jgi:hypothetical protein